MMLNNSMVDRKTLSWIKEGVDETLQTVQDALYEFAEHDDDVAAIQACVEPLQRVRGALQMVGVEGAAMLAAEMEQLARGLAEGKVKRKQDAAEVLATGIIQLPGYLESLYHGQPDLPLVLLPILNDFRACQDKALFTEGDFFSPNLLAKVPLQMMSEGAISGDIVTVAKQLRPTYLTALLGVIKDEDVILNREKLAVVLESLLAASQVEPAKQLWWIALGIIDSLRDGGLEASVAIKILLGRVDREMSRLIKQGEQSLASEPPAKLIKNLLYYIAQSNSSSERVQQIRSTFALSHVDNSAVDSARESLYGFNVGLVDTIAKQLEEELSTIKCELDVVLHSKGGSTEGLDGVLKNFATIADALGMLGLHKQKELISEQHAFLSSKFSGGETLTEEELLTVATALLYIESALSDLCGAMSQAGGDYELTSAEYGSAVKLVAQEIAEVFKDIKDSVNEYSLDPANIMLMAEVPEQLRNIAGVMRTLEDEEQANLTRSICHFMDQEVIINKAEISMASLDLLADAILGVENYYQSLLEESVAPEIGLKVAAESLTQLGYPPEEKGTVLTLEDYAEAGNDFSMEQPKTGTNDNC
jgi:chemosensory pili system protein ChpA (sensor histidine kinase/response regulator)